MEPQSLVLLCRPGFEKECVAEAVEQGTRRGLALAGIAEPGAGMVELRAACAGAVAALHATLDYRELVFARDGFAGRAFQLPDARDRITPLAAIAAECGPAATAWLQHLDTEEGRSLGRLCTRLDARLQGALRESRLLREAAAQRLHLLLLTGTSGFAGTSHAATGGRWSMGIPRLRLPGAPSRSAAKLEEAVLWFLGDAAAVELKAGMSVVDLGAAPGGWSWVLARRGLRVTAIDHGALSPDVFAAGAVCHVAADAFTWRPVRPVDWMVCDIVDKPARVADLVGRWFENRWCRQAIFNLKLPMKTRYRESSRLLTQIVERLGGEKGGLRCRARQLYHDREEITVHLRRA